jgi:hypothetical protein
MTEQSALARGFRDESALPRTLGSPSHGGNIGSNPVGVTAARMPVVYWGPGVFPFRPQHDPSRCAIVTAPSRPSRSGGKQGFDLIEYFVVLGDGYVEVIAAL